jgi:hypothetical protein
MLLPANCLKSFVSQLANSHSRRKEGRRRKEGKKNRRKEGQKEGSYAFSSGTSTLEKY